MSEQSGIRADEISGSTEPLGRRFGDGLAVGADLEGAAEVAVGQALRGLRGSAPDLVCVLVAPGAGQDPERAAAAGRRAMLRAAPDPRSARPPPG